MRWTTYHDVCVFGVGCAGADVGMTLRELLRLLVIFAVVLLRFGEDMFRACVGVCIHVLLLCGVLLRDRDAAFDRHADCKLASRKRLLVCELVLEQP